MVKAQHDPQADYRKMLDRLVKAVDKYTIAFRDEEEFESMTPALRRKWRRAAVKLHGELFACKLVLGHDVRDAFPRETIRAGYPPPGELL